MQWRGRRESSNVEHQGSGRRMAVGGGVGALVIAGIAFLLTGDPRALFEAVKQGPQQAEQREPTPAEKEAEQFVAVVLADTEEVWHELFRKMGKRYQEPKLVLFRGSVESASGSRWAAAPGA